MVQGFWTRNSDPAWRQTSFIEAITNQAKKAFRGVEYLKFHKLLVYHKGCGFGLHVDQKRASGMTHTVIVNIPVEGGNEYEYVAGSKARIRNDTKVNLCAFRFDVPHAIRMIKGRRLCLVFHAYSFVQEETFVPIIKRPRFFPDSAQTTSERVD